MIGKKKIRRIIDEELDLVLNEKIFGTNLGAAAASAARRIGNKIGGLGLGTGLAVGGAALAGGAVLTRISPGSPALVATPTNPNMSYFFPVPVASIDSVLGSPPDPDRPIPDTTDEDGIVHVGEGSRPHNGFDILVLNEYVCAVDSGEIVRAGYGQSGGNQITIRHKNAPFSETSYYHLSAMYVEQGDAVDAGTIIGRSGDTGLTSGAHLHFSIDHSHDAELYQSFFSNCTTWTVSSQVEADGEEEEISETLSLSLMREIIVEEFNKELLEIIYGVNLGALGGGGMAYSGDAASKASSTGGSAAAVSGLGNTDASVSAREDDASGAGVGGAAMLGLAGFAGGAALLSGGEIESDDIERIDRLSSITGVPSSVIYAIESVESSHRPGVFAFNGHVFRDGLDTQQEQDLAEEAGFTMSQQNFYGSDAESAFSDAYLINPSAAIEGGAWGLYQVLGRSSLPLYGNDPELFMDSFRSDPVDHSEKSFIQWVADKGSYWVDDTVNMNTAEWVRGYYGVADRDYINKVEKHISDWNSSEG
tara:strand:- start:4577 stop:6178 length:1602 start_codon:yes stop_codon:yes gene_type:complete